MSVETSRPRHAGGVRPAAAAAVRAGAVLSVAGAAAFAAAGSAQASVADLSDPLATVGYALAPAADLQLNPMSDTGVDPLDNSVGTQVADFKPISTEVVTDPFTSGGSLNDLTGGAAGLLLGGLPYGA